ncbi:MAG: hypothetical protein JSU63_12280 [Phycisphaerales bacterium]|nr:MAG: hypothetical protein JSU63_12280 [Phycisphaerales bacterium]
MTIRFQCPSCSQPIETDDEWASKTVACPYCRKTVTAPAESTIEDVAAIPTASPLEPPPVPPGFMPEPGYLPVAGEPASSNRVAVVALILAFASLAMLVSINLVVGPYEAEMLELGEALSQAQDFAEYSEIQAEFFREHDGLFGPLMASGVILICCGMTWLAAVVCAIIGLRRTVRRQFAIGALVIAGLVPVIVCCGGLIA